MKTAAIIVTFNRLEKLKKTLSCYDRIRGGIDYLIIVNNHSTDGTEDFLNEWAGDKTRYNKVVVNLEDNLGGSGGFYYGCKKALEFPVDWILLADDDAYPDSQIMQHLTNYVQNHNTKDVCAICSSVYKVNNTIDIGHRKSLKYKYGIRPLVTPISEIDYQKESFVLDLFSYVGVFLKAETLRNVGLCIPELFIYYDDMEHSMRVGKYGDIVCVPSIKYVHDDGLKQSKSASDVLMSWRDYYDIRNKIYILLKHKPIAGIFWALSRVFMCFYQYSFSLKCQKMYLTAILHGCIGHLGKHKIYKPGFSILRCQK